MSETTAEALVQQACAALSDYEDPCPPEQLVARIERVLQSYGALRVAAAALEAREARAREAHLARHQRLSEAVGMDLGYSCDATVDEAIKRLAMVPDPSKLESRADLHQTATRLEKEGLAVGSGSGFTQTDVDKLRAMPDGTGYASIDDPEWFESLIARIDAVAGPRTAAVCGARCFVINPPGDGHTCAQAPGHHGWHTCGERHNGRLCGYGWPNVTVTFDAPPLDRARTMIGLQSGVDQPPGKTSSETPT